MAHFFAAIEPDPARRAVIRDAVIGRLKELSDLKIGSTVVGNAIAVWAMLDGAPQDQAMVPGAVGVLLGESIPRGEGRRRSARDRLDEWAAPASPSGLPRHDGFSLFLRLSEDTVGVQPDLLGIFPVFHTVCDGTRLVSSSPWLLAAHPGFRMAVDPEGLVGLLLANSIFSGRTVYLGVRRLEAGAILVSDRDEGWREVPGYQIPVTRSGHHLPVPEIIARLDELLKAAVARHLAGVGPSLLLLSGGLDSRLLAGLLSRAALPITAVTHGVPTDMDARLAGPVARACGFQHHLTTRTARPRGLASAIRWDGLTHAPGSGGGGQRISIRGNRVVNGHLMDSIMGGSHMLAGYDRATRTTGFDTFLTHIGRWGLSPATLGRLLRRDVFGDALEAVTDRIRVEYQSAGDSGLERAWRFDIRHRQRLHIGHALWRLAFSDWPSTPGLDQEVIAAVAEVPLPLVSERRLQVGLLLRKFPRLASLPIDRDSDDTRAHDPRLRDLVTQDIRARLQQTIRSLRPGQWTPPERRYYHRVFDLNGPGWRAIRSDLEPHRELAYQLFERDAFDTLVPSPEARWMGNGITDASGIKTLLGTVSLLRQVG